MSYAPIAVFAYKRPDHLLQTLTSLSECELADKSHLFIFCDGPKNERDEAAVRKVREVAASRQWCAEVEIISQEQNQGLARSVIAGVTRLCNEFGRIVVLEDDMLLSRGFLDYINRALIQYENATKVLQVSGHVFPFCPTSAEADAFFLPVSTTQGWGTWKRAWDLFDPSASGWEKLLTEKNMQRSFDLGGVFPYSKMLQTQMAGGIDSWAIRWWWSFFKNNGLCLCPRESLVYNIGFDEQGTHTKTSDYYYNDKSWSKERYVVKIPETVKVESESFVSLKKYHRKKHSFVGKVINRIISLRRALC